MAETNDVGRLSCPACGHELSTGSGFDAVDRLHRTHGHFRVLVCESCRSGLTTPVVTADRLKEFYPAGYGPYEDPSNPVIRLISSAIRAWQARRGLATFPLRALRESGAGRGVDVGCGRGDLAASLIGIGWQMTGIEPSPDAAANAQSRGVDVRVGTLATVRLEPARYDAAVFQHSLEHTPDPLADLTATRAALVPGGLVAITVPNFSNWQARRLGSRWYHLDVPRHRSHFSGDGLSRLLDRAGFEPVQVRTSTSAVGLPASLQYAVAGRCLFPDGLALRISTGLCALALPVATVADRLGGGGDQLHVVARRPG